LSGIKDHNPEPVEYDLLEENESPRPLIPNHPFIKCFKEAKVIQYNDLTADIKESIGNFEYLKNGLYLPLFSTEGLEGVIVLGQKVSEDPYDGKDKAFFETLMIQAKAFLDRIRPYEKVKKDYEASQKKLMDKERLLARSEKLVSMAKLVQEYNHQIKTPLAIVRGRVEMLFDQARDAEYLKKMQKIIIEQINRADSIVEDTLRLSQPKPRSEIRLDINDVINDALKIYHPVGISLKKDLSSAPLFIKGDREDLQLAFINLFKNAGEAMPDGGGLTVKTYAATDGDSQIVCAEVIDTGCGIPDENLEKIFEPFFSTHITEGRGLGLSIVFRIMREHFSKIEVKSKLGAGSTFKLQFDGVKI
ncbi:MAG: ATP-binding protein, partial [bacterium]